MKPTLNDLASEYTRLKLENDVIEQTIRRFDLDLELTKRSLDSPEFLEGEDAELFELVPTAYQQDDDEEEG